MLNGSSKSKAFVSISIILAYVLLWAFMPQEYTHRFFYINPIFRIVDYMVGMAAALYYLNIKDKESVKNVTENKTILLYLLSIASFVGLLTLSELDKQLVLHSVVYMPLICILLISISLNGVLAGTCSSEVRINQFCILPCTSDVHKIFTRSYRQIRI